MREIISTVGMMFVGRWLWIKAHTAMMTILIECWDNQTCMFHLSIGVAMIILLDVWRILNIPIRGIVPDYRLDGGNTTYARCVSMMRCQWRVHRGTLGVDADTTYPLFGIIYMRIVQWMDYAKPQQAWIFHWLGSLHVLYGGRLCDLYMGSSDAWSAIP